MEFKGLAELYQRLESTTKRLEKVSYLASFLRHVDDKELSTLILLCQGKLYPGNDEATTGVASKIVAKAVSVSTGVAIEKVEDGWRKTGDLGLVAANLFVNKKQQTLFSEVLSTQKVFSTLRKLSDMTGEGAVRQKIQTLSGLFSSAVSIEAKYIVRLSLEQMRLGVGEGILRDAITSAYLPTVVGVSFKCKECHTWSLDMEKCLNCGKELENKPLKEIALFKGDKALKVLNVKELEEKDLHMYEFILPSDEKVAREVSTFFSESVQHAFDKINDYSEVAKIAKHGSIKGLSQVKLVAGSPIKVMLYLKALGIKDAFERVGKPCALEYKYDGFRMQVHKTAGNKDIAIYTRRLENVTRQFPDVVHAVKKYVSGDSFILDAEAVGYNPSNYKYLAFQSVSQRIRRKYDIEKLAEKFPVELNVFDILFFDGKDLLNEPFHVRRKILSSMIEPKQGHIEPSTIMITDKEEEANAFYQRSLDAGNEGIMAKNLDGVYKPGARVGYGVKVKPVMESLDVVVVGAQWGEGKRAQWLTSFTVACVDEEGNFLELGKVGTGIKELEGEDVTFTQLTELLRPLITDEFGQEVKVKPKIVIEVHYEEIQKSPSYSSGYALRFPRLLRLREDRSVEDVTDISFVEELYGHQRGRG